MAITYDELIDEVPRIIYAQNRSIVADMDIIIRQAHDEVIQKLDHDLFRAVIQGLTLTTTGLLDLSLQDPRVFEVRAMRLRYRASLGWTPLLRRDIERLSMLYPQPRPRRPRYYAEYPTVLQYQFFPTPDADYEIEITANVEPPLLAPSQQTNVISEQFPRVVEMACLWRAAVYMKNQADAGLYQGELQSALTEANMQIARRRRDETGKRPKETANSGGK